MFDLIEAGPFIGPLTGVWDLAWQSPTTGFALLACLPTLALTGFFLVTRDTSGATAEPVTRLVGGAHPTAHADSQSHDQHGRAVA